MTDAALAMRRHESDMTRAIQLSKTDLSEEQRQETAATAAASFHEAQSKWEAYRQHLIQHGLIPAE
jgi:hypothetical protein